MFTHPAAALRALVLLLAVWASTAPTVAQAGCKGGLYLFPTPGSVIPTNSKLILEGAGPEADRVLKLAGREDLMLRSKNDEVLVRVGKKEGTDLWKSTMNRVAVLLTPSKPLQPAEQYTLMIDKVLPGFQLLNETGVDAPSWMTGGGLIKQKDANGVPTGKEEKSNGIDTGAPRYQIKPAVAEGYYHKDGDALVRYLKLHVVLAEEAPAWFLITMTRARGNLPPQRYPVPINGESAILGHDACSGGFSFDDGRAYRLQIETYDSAGNKAAEALKLIEVQAPRPL